METPPPSDAPREEPVQGELLRPGEQPGGAQQLPPLNPDLLVQVMANLNLYQGVLPPPNILEQYDKLVPGSAERLLRMVESQTTHRQALELNHVSEEAKRSRLGLVAGSIVTIGIEVIAGMLIVTGNAGAGAGLCGFSLVALAGVFVYGTRSRSQERLERARYMTQEATRAAQPQAPQEPDHRPTQPPG